MAKLAIIFGVVLVGCALLQAADEKPAPPLTANATDDQILESLHTRGDTLKDFMADVAMTESGDAAVGEESTITSGKVWVQRRDAGDSRIRVTFIKRQVGDKIYDEKRDFLLDKGWLKERDFKNRKEINRQVVKPGQKIDLLKLGEGPFPLPIGQPPEEVRKMFEISRPQAVAGAPENSVAITLNPKPDTELVRKFKSIMVCVDLKTAMPVRIDTVARDDSQRSTVLTNVRINTDLAEGTFEMPDISKEQPAWDRQDEPYDR